VLSGRVTRGKASRVWSESLGGVLWGRYVNARRLGDDEKGINVVMTPPPRDPYHINSLLHLSRDWM
jgi:hypothetical protein